MGHLFFLLKLSHNLSTWCTYKKDLIYIFIVGGGGGGDTVDRPFIIRSSLNFGQIELNLYDASASWSATAVSCSDPVCTSSKVSSSAAVCLSQTKQCGYSFKYGDGSGTSGYYVSDDIYFNIMLDQSINVNSSASITFGYVISTILKLAQSTYYVVPDSHTHT